MEVESLFNVLSLDGGGIRGVISAVWLRALQERVNRPLSQCFDLIAGTSTGSVLGASVALDLDLNEIVELYAKHGHRIFPTKQLNSTATGFAQILADLFKPKYKPKPLADKLQKTFGRARNFSEVKGKLLITTYDVFNRRSFLIRSYDPEFAEVPIWEGCLASCSAPVYFPAHILKFKGAEFPLIDGGVVANNPAALALAEAVHLQDADSLEETSRQIFVSSFGTGNLTRPIQVNEALQWGGVNWVLPIIDVLFDGSADSVNLTCQRILKNDHYERLQVELHGASDDMDDASEHNVGNLRRLAEGYIQNEGSEILEKIIERLNDIELSEEMSGEIQDGKPKPLKRRKKETAE